MTTTDKLIGRDRNGEGSLWKLLRLWPVILAIVAISGTIYATTADVSTLKEAQSAQWKAIGGNKAEVGELKTQTRVIEEKLRSVDEKLSEQRTDIKSILRELKR